MTKLLKLEKNITYFFLTMFLKRSKEAKILSSFEENTLRNTLGREEQEEPMNILKDFSKEFDKLKIQNHRDFGFEKEGEKDVHYNERGRSFEKGSKFVRSKSNPRFYREARSQSWNRARSQSRNGRFQRFHKVVGTRYWNNREEKKKVESRVEKEREEKEKRKRREKERGHSTK